MQYAEPLASHGAAVRRAHDGGATPALGLTFASGASECELNADAQEDVSRVPAEIEVLLPAQNPRGMKKSLALLLFSMSTACRRPRSLLHLNSRYQSVVASMVR